MAVGTVMVLSHLAIDIPLSDPIFVTIVSLRLVLLYNVSWTLIL